MLRIQKFSCLLLALLTLPVAAPQAQERPRITIKKAHPREGLPVQKQKGDPRPSDEEAVADCLRILGSIATVDYSRPEGPRIRVRPDVPAGAIPPEQLRVGSYNWENVLDYQGQREWDPATGQWVWTADPYQKPAARLAQNIDVELRSNEDVGFGIEIEGMNPITQIIHDHLGDRYLVLCIKGNDDRGIQVVFKFKKDLPFWYEYLSHRNLTVTFDGAVRELFSRDLPVVLLRLAGTGDDSVPFLILAGTHLKSQRDGPNDPMSKRFRTVQLIEMIRILLGFQKRYPRTPILLMGDFNADIRTAEEFKEMWKQGFRDSFDVAQSVALADRITQIYFPNGKPAVHSQLDGIILNMTAVMADVLLAAEIVPYLNPDGTVMPLPKNFEDRLKQGSDHRKVQVILDLAKILREFQARAAEAQAAEGKPLSALDGHLRHFAARAETDRRAPVTGAAADIDLEIALAA